MSPATITGVALALLGFVIASVGAVLGPQWLLIWIGGGLVLAGLAAGWGMTLAGYGDH